MINIIDEHALIAKVATDIVKDSFTGAWGKVKGFFKDLSAKEAVEFGHAYERYLENTDMNHRKIKTLIYRRVPKDLYSFYECIGLIYNGETIDTDSINNITSNEGKILITGTGGGGKSTLFKHLYLNAIKETSLIPILIELRSINSTESKDISLYDIIFRSLVDNGSSHPGQLNHLLVGVALQK